MDEDLLDMFERIERETAEKKRREEEESAGSSSDGIEFNMSQHSDNSQSEWLESSKKNKKSNEWRSTSQQSVPLANLVWAHNKFFKGASCPYFPARLCDKYETAATPIGKERIPGTVIVEFLSRPTTSSFGDYLQLLNDDEVYPFNRQLLNVVCIHTTYRLR
jgi:hypothetical protein